MGRLMKRRRRGQTVWRHQKVEMEMATRSWAKRMLRPAKRSPPSEGVGLPVIRAQS